MCFVLVMELNGAFLLYEILNYIRSCCFTTDVYKFET